MKPLEGYLVLDFCQYLSGPYAALRLADFGAHVWKVENPEGGDLYRSLNISNLRIDGDQPIFHAANRGKESLAVDLKDAAQRPMLEKLIGKADVMLVNYRPGVAKRLGLDYETVRALNPGIVYGSISGYGAEGPWASRSGQDLLAQSVSGLPFLNGNQNQPPLPMGVGVTDIVSGEQLVQGVLSGLYRKAVSGEGACVEVSLLEAALDIQFEGLTAFLNDGELPVRSAVHNANPYIGAPYGIYSTKNGYLAIAMTPIPGLGELLDCPALLAYQDSASWSDKRDEIKAILVGHLLGETTEHWLSLLEPADIWCANVQNWDQLLQTEGYRVLGMEQDAITGNGVPVRTLRCPIRIDGERYYNAKGAPKLGEHDAVYLDQVLRQE
ncbi:CaiB/BaiF CoA-transferase family protein [Oscillibacter sp.]|uniref:CaiB/BaiF CoA transferase family protein n=1 Tax=Oscillibacter sp. TaxID=1945593 RepID=UPI002617F8BD|nr:CaiB/BaiF CoA-transferase family protein [Oscillibacter sp.]MDD3347979.1 CaiB/BaiF CoA-transferase family protein [Oscillibacter sp.]